MRNPDLYILKPQLAEAMVYDGTGESLDWLIKDFEQGMLAQNGREVYKITGGKPAVKGDYIIKYNSGEIGFCKPDEFFAKFMIIDNARHTDGVSMPQGSYSISIDVDREIE